ncbi:type 1 glutamine amidotransferase domain-containing protein [Ralstonia soli]|uniref:Type 1 glutamine amidotransferase n=1 Tax=Ralstonia soli TaxID=2953896 RepID=A0ABT1AF37_9RALS|nr:type 1 glutamine amidotransferase domain-containing protein [Ralstonia soli]MCO5397004.1 type 1 glutamine amidotransferase [Ralstonia soli]
MTTLHDMRIAILVHDLFEQAELASPKQALEAAGATTAVIAPKAGSVTGLHHDTKADKFKVDLVLDYARADDFHGLVLPGGVFNADALRMVPAAQAFVKAFEQAQKPIAVICHGPWLMVSAGLVRGRTLTSWPSLQDDIRNAGGTWVDQEVVTDRNWVSSRKPDDLPAFNRTFIELLAQHAHA